MFKKFQSRRQKRRGFTEDPAAPFKATRRDAGASSELIDFALVDATVNEWMAEAAKQQANRSQADREVEVRRLVSGPAGTTSPTEAHFPTEPEVQKTVPSAPVPTRVTAPRSSRSRPVAPQCTQNLDRVHSAAVAEQVISEDVIKQCMSIHNLDGFPTWPSALPGRRAAPVQGPRAKKQDQVASHQGQKQGESVEVTVKERKGKIDQYQERESKSHGHPG